MMVGILIILFGFVGIGVWLAVHKPGEIAEGDDESASDFE